MKENSGKNEGTVDGVERASFDSNNGKAPRKHRCYMCRNENVSIIRNKLRHNINRNVIKCNSCEVVYLEPREDDLRNYYREAYKTRYSGVIGGSLSSKENFRLSLPLQQGRINEIKHLISPATVALDIGCSAGFFLYALKDYVHDCIGIEYNEEDAQFVERELGIKIYREPIEHTDVPHESFDLITLFQVLEHIEDPLGFLKTVSKYLKPDGYICIEVPNIGDALISIYHVESYADFWFREPHVFYFSPRTLLMLLEKSGFTGIVKTTQNYSILNHMNWIMKGEPQPDFSVGKGEPKLLDGDTVDNGIAAELNLWIQRMDKEYKEFLTKHGLGENVLYIGQKN